MIWRVLTSLNQFTANPRLVSRAQCFHDHAVAIVWRPHGAGSRRKIQIDHAHLRQADRQVGPVRSSGPVRGGQFNLNSKEKEDALKDKFVTFISSVSDGPIDYRGRSMADAHKGMNITGEQFDALAKSLRAALLSNQAGAAEIEELMKKVESTRADIVGK